MLKGQDIAVLLKLSLPGREAMPIHQLATELAMSPSEIHNGIQRAADGRLIFVEGKRGKGGMKRSVSGHALLELLVHGVRYVYPPELGTEVRGLPTSYAAPVFKGHIVFGGLPPVWPDPFGKVRGLSFSPLYPNAVKAAAADSDLYDLLALVDALRGGRARERNFAADQLKKRLEKRAV